MPRAILLIAHGSRSATANDDLHHVADLLRQREHPIVVASFLELAEPNIEAGGRECVRLGADEVVMVPYFLSAGVHVRRDLTAARQGLSEVFPAVPFVLAEPLGRHPLLVEIVEERMRQSITTQE